MTKQLSKKLTPEFIEAVLLNDTEGISKLNPGYSEITMNIMRAMANSYKLDPKVFQKSYRCQGKILKKYIKNFVTEFPDLIVTPRTKLNKSRPRVKSTFVPLKIKPKKKETKVMPQDSKIEPEKLHQTIKSEKIEAKEVLNLLANTIKTIQLLIEKL